MHGLTSVQIYLRVKSVGEGSVWVLHTSTYALSRICL